MTKTGPQIKIPDKLIMSKIIMIRGQKVILDRDIAELYEVETKALKQVVKRNIDIFPGNFMFVLTIEEFKNLRSQIVTSSWGGQRYLPFVFTELGVLQLANVLKSISGSSLNHGVSRREKGVTRFPYFNDDDLAEVFRMRYQIPD